MPRWGPESGISTALTEYEESIRDDDLQPHKAMLETLRLIARMCDDAFGLDLRPEAMGIDHDEIRRALVSTAAGLVA